MRKRGYAKIASLVKASCLVFNILYAQRASRRTWKGCLLLPFAVPAQERGHVVTVLGTTSPQASQIQAGTSLSAYPSVHASPVKYRQLPCLANSISVSHSSDFMLFLNRK